MRRWAEKHLGTWYSMEGGELEDRVVAKTPPPASDGREWKEREKSGLAQCVCRGWLLGSVFCLGWQHRRASHSSLFHTHLYTANVRSGAHGRPENGQSTEGGCRQGVPEHSSGGDREGENGKSKKNDNPFLSTQKLYQVVVPLLLLLFPCFLFPKKFSFQLVRQAVSKAVSKGQNDKV